MELIQQLQQLQLVEQLLLFVVVQQQLQLELQHELERRGRQLGRRRRELQLVTLLGLWIALAVPAIQAPVTDLYGAIPPANEAVLSQQLIDLRADTGVQMAVLVVGTTDGPIEDYAQAVFDRWGGGSTTRDDGVLFILAIDDRRNRLHLGYGLEQVIPDHVAQQMLDGLRPLLRAADYSGACHAIVALVAERVAHIEPEGPIPWDLGAVVPLMPVLIINLAVLAGALWLLLLFPRKGRAPPNRKWWTLALWVGAPLLVALVFLEGHLFWLGYGLAWLIAAGAGALGGLFARALRAGGVTWLVLMAGSAWIAYAFPVAVDDGLDVLVLGTLWLIPVGFAVVPSLFVGAAFDPATAGTWSSSGGSWSSGSSSSYGSSWSSSSSSSSSSSASTSWSGGGGSSGGGGASSSW